MRIYVTGFSDLSGEKSTPGGMVHLLEVCRNLQDLGHEVTLFIGSPKPYPGTLPFPVVYLPYLDVRYLASLTVPVFLFFALLWKGMWRRPAVIYENCVTYSLGGVLAAKLLGAKHAMHVHGFYIDEMAMGGHGRFRIGIVKFFEQWNYRLTDALYCVTPVVREKVIETFKVPPAVAHFIYNGVDAERCRPRPKSEAAAALGVDPDKPYVGFIGYLFPWSGVDQLIVVAPQVLAACPGTRFVIVGHGLWGDQLPGMAEAAGVRDSFDFVGYQPWDKVPLWSALFDVGVTPYPGAMGVGRYRSSMKSLEYSAAATPVVISRCEGVSDIVENGRCGLIVPPDDPEALAAAIIRLLQDPELRRELGANGRRLIEQGYTWRHVAEKMVAALAVGHDSEPS
jgi:glycosyltransferase involved in cell wall biosynthesis